MRIVIAEDQYLLRAGLSRLLAAYDIETAAAVESGEALLAAIEEHQPDLAIVDVRLPPTYSDEGLRAAVTARAATPDLPILVLSQHVEALYARELLADGRGGVGYLLKDRVFNDGEFIEAVRRVASGGTAMDPEVIATLVNSSPRHSPLIALTPRELQVLELMAEGRSNAAIARQMFMSESAVSKHTASIFDKLGLVATDDDNRRVLAVLAYLGESADR
ncbi:MAG TPA: response regulator transcription factor [Pseudonocardiaceae bacterium]|nr:response regulator transcription factor [Pseudonocardiaceae bacterium]